jgi:D-arabinose 1-dehydrogenase-like Zn-dependent alcohol dehydrogenase
MDGWGMIRILSYPMCPGMRSPGSLKLSAKMLQNGKLASGLRCHLFVAVEIAPMYVRKPSSFNSIANLRKRGKHVQVGLMLADHSRPAVPMDKVIANELEIIGSHGIQAYRYSALLEMINSGKLHPQKLIGKTISLDESAEELTNMDNFAGTGVTVINRF